MMVQNSIPTRTPSVNLAKQAFDEYKAIVENTKQEGDLFSVNVDGQKIDGNVEIRDVGKAPGQPKRLEAHTGSNGWDEAEESWTIGSVDGVDNMMIYTRTPMDGSPGIAQRFFGNFRLPSKGVVA